MTVIVQNQNNVVILADSKKNYVAALKGTVVINNSNGTGNSTVNLSFNETNGFTGNFTNGNLTIDLQNANATQSGKLTSTDWQRLDATVTNVSTLQSNVTTIENTLNNKINVTANVTNNALIRYDGTTGKAVKNSVLIADDGGNVSGVQSLQLSNGSTQTLTAGKLWYNNQTGSLNFGMGNSNITQQVGEELFIYGKASTAIDDSVLTLIYKTGVVGASGVVEFAPAVSGITNDSLILGVATESIAHNGFGRIATYGIVHDVNTTGAAYSETWANGDVIWYNPATGGLTKTKPTAPNLKFQVGTVIDAHTNGDFFVELIHGSSLGGTDNNVELSNLTTGDIITYNGNLSRFENRQLIAGSNINITTGVNGNITISANTSSGGITGFTNANGFTGNVTNGNLSLVLQYANATQGGQISNATFNNIAGAIGNISTLQSDVAALNSSMIYIGGWDASTGTFPSSAQSGYVYSVTTGGTVNGITFNETDRIVAIVDNASTTTYAGNWLKEDYTDLVISVNGQVGAVNLTTANVSDSTNKRYVNETQLSALNNVTNIHSSLTNLTWTTSGHTGNVSSIPAFDSLGQPTLLTQNGSGSVALTSNVSLTNANLTTPILGTPQSGNLTNCNGNATNLTAGNVNNLNVTGGSTTITGILNTTNGGTGANVTGLVLALQRVDNVTSTYSNGTAAIPNDNTPPQSSEGTLFLAKTITPKTVNSTLIIEVNSFLSCNVGGSLVITGAIFANTSGANAIRAAQVPIPYNNATMQMLLTDRITPNTTSPVNITFRVGQGSSNLVSQNGLASGAILGGAAKSSLVITEIIETP